MMSSPLVASTPSLGTVAPLRLSRCETPRTPEPMAMDESCYLRAPSPPRPRLRLKRRAVSAQNPLAAPTQQFLASVAAADIPIPSIEEPEIASDDDADMTNTLGAVSRMDHPCLHSGLESAGKEAGLSPKPRGRQFSVPKTPAPGVAPSLSPTRYPNWSNGSSISSPTDDDLSSDPDYSSLSRPSTSRSTHTSSSLFSRLSHFSDDNCASPEPEPTRRRDFDVDFLDIPSGDGSNNNNVAVRPRNRKAPWTKAMSRHLWATYMVYLQDPTVTPFRTGKSCIPPHGVCLRVAREAKKSWKGSRAAMRTETTVAPIAASQLKSGSSTPTAEASGPYIEWPHTCAATRRHLRELCKLRAAAPGGGLGLRYMSRSPTPFVHPASRHWDRRSMSARNTGSTFATKDIAMSLTMSTSESMNPNGPLAQLTGSLISPVEPTPRELRPRILATPEQLPPTSGEDQSGQLQPSPTFETPRRLGSPFIAKSYGPSSTSSLAAVLGVSGSGSAYTTRQAPHTVVGQRRATLQSPVRLSSRMGAHRRRSTALAGGRTSQYELRRKRPSVGDDFWTAPSYDAPLPFAQSLSSSRNIGARDVEPAAGLQQHTTSEMGSSAAELFIPRATESLRSSAMAGHQGPQPLSNEPLATCATDDVSQLDAPSNPPARLGSPFSMSNTSFSFPSRFFQPSSYDAVEDSDILIPGGREKPFATVQPAHQPQHQAALAAGQPPPSSSCTFGEGPAGITGARGPSAAAAEGCPAGRDNLARRLAYIDERLKEFRSRDINRRRSDSPL